MFDIIIENGQIFDGTGNPWFRADIGILGKTIVKIGSLDSMEATERIDAQNYVVCPGFIDIHCHSDALLFADPREEGKIRQGVTTETIGNCGISAEPTSPHHLDLLKKYAAPLFGQTQLAWNWHDMGSFLSSIEDRGSITNVAAMIGQGTVRIAVMGFDNREPSPQEMEAMKQLVALDMEQGAFGMSSGLIYPPGVFSKTDELVELCKVVSHMGGFYSTHIRGETDSVIDSVQEAINIGAMAKIPVEISHHKSMGRSNWQKSVQTLQMMENARRNGLDITCDVYPYIAGSSQLSVLLPPWAHEGGVENLLSRLHSDKNRQRLSEEIVHGLPGWDNFVKAAGWDGIFIASCKKNKEHEGKNMQEIAELRGVNPAVALFDILIEEDGDVLMIHFSMCEDDVQRIMKHPLSMIGSDAIPSPGKPHPRYYGTFPRVIKKYVKEEHALGIHDAIRKMTFMPAQKLGLRDRGLIREEMYADITIFDYDRIADKATYTKPQQYPEGIQYVLVNGKVAVRDGQYTGLVNGQVLRRC